MDRWICGCVDELEYKTEGKIRFDFQCIAWLVGRWACLLEFGNDTRAYLRVCHTGIIWSDHGKKDIV